METVEQEIRMISKDQVRQVLKRMKNVKAVAFDVQSCSNCREIKLMNHIMKIEVEKVHEFKW